MLRDSYCQFYMKCLDFLLENVDNNVPWWGRVLVLPTYRDASASSTF